MANGGRDAGESKLDSPGLRRWEATGVAVALPRQDRERWVARKLGTRIVGQSHPGFSQLDFDRPMVGELL